MACPRQRRWGRYCSNQGGEPHEAITLLLETNTNPFLLGRPSSALLLAGGRLKYKNHKYKICLVYNPLVIVIKYQNSSYRYHCKQQGTQTQLLRCDPTHAQIAFRHLWNHMTGHAHHRLSVHINEFHKLQRSHTDNLKKEIFSYLGSVAVSSFHPEDNPLSLCVHPSNYPQSGSFTRLVCVL